MNIKIPWSKPYLDQEENRLVTHALESSWISGGPYVKAFERKFAKLHKQTACVTTTNGTSALYLALSAIGIQPHDEVIIPAFGFMAAANMTLALYARPVYADIHPSTWCMDAASIEKKITARTRAIVAVHPYGNVCDMKAIRALAQKYRLRILEDAAQSAFSSYGGRLAGTWGDIGCFSFQATKMVTTAEGGCVLTSDPRLERRMRLIRDHGMSPRKRYWHETLGHNFRLTNIQAAIGIAQLGKLKSILRLKKRIHELYLEHLGQEEGIRFQEFHEDVQPVVWAVAACIAPRILGISRDRLIQRLALKGIETRPGFYPPSVMPFYKTSRLPVAESISKNMISFPSYPSLEEKQIEYICGQIKRIKNEK